VIEKRYAAEEWLARHEHESAYVSFLLAGAYLEVSHPDERDCSPGTVIWHPRTEVHADRFHSCGGHLLDLEIDAEWLSDTAQEFRLVPRARMFRGGLPYLLGLRIYRALGADSCEVEDSAIDLLSFFFVTAPSGSIARCRYAAELAINNCRWPSSQCASESTQCTSPAAFGGSWDVRSATIWPRSVFGKLSSCCAIRKAPSSKWHTPAASPTMPTCAEPSKSPLVSLLPPFESASRLFPKRQTKIHTG